MFTISFGYFLIFFSFSFTDSSIYIMQVQGQLQGNLNNSHFHSRSSHATRDGIRLWKKTFGEKCDSKLNKTVDISYYLDSNTQYTIRKSINDAWFHLNSFCWDFDYFEWFCAILIKTKGIFVWFLSDFMTNNPKLSYFYSFNVFNLFWIHASNFLTEKIFWINSLIYFIQFNESHQVISLGASYTHSLRI